MKKNSQDLENSKELQEIIRLMMQKTQQAKEDYEKLFEEYKSSENYNEDVDLEVLNSVACNNSYLVAIFDSKHHSISSKCHKEQRTKGSCRHKIYHSFIGIDWSQRDDSIAHAEAMEYMVKNYDG